MTRYRADLWTSGSMLKRDVFSSVERGTYLHDGKPMPAVRRSLTGIPFWSSPLAFLLLWRERRALRHVGEIDGLPSMLAESETVVVRRWVDGLAMHLAKPSGENAYFKSAFRLLLSIHRAGIVHNDLAKEQNWLRRPDGSAGVTDFQLASVVDRHGRIARVARYEDLRHLLKHKRRYCPDALTAREQRILARKSVFAQIWSATFKKVYIRITRNVLRFTDREGGGPRLVFDGPVIVEKLAKLANVRHVAVASFPHRGAGVGLYVFVETDQPLAREAALAALPAAITPPEFIQSVAALPRDAQGAIRQEILQLIAANQIDLIEGLTLDAGQRAVVTDLVQGRMNLTDRFNFT